MYYSSMQVRAYVEYSLRLNQESIFLCHNKISVFFFKAPCGVYQNLRDAPNFEQFTHELCTRYISIHMS